MFARQRAGRGPAHASRPVDELGMRLARDLAALRQLITKGNEAPLATVNDVRALATAFDVGSGPLEASVAAYRQLASRGRPAALAEIARMAARGMALVIEGGHGAARALHDGDNRGFHTAQSQINRGATFLEQAATRYNAFVDPSSASITSGATSPVERTQREGAGYRFVGLSWLAGGVLWLIRRVSGQGEPGE